MTDDYDYDEKAMKKMADLLKLMTVVTDKSYLIINYFQQLEKQKQIDLSEGEKKVLDDWVESYYALVAYMVKVNKGDSTVH